MPNSSRFLITQGRFTNTQSLKFNALAVKHAKDVVIWRNKETHRVRKGGVIRKPLRVRMPVRADDGQTLDALVKRTSDTALMLI